MPGINTLELEGVSTQSWGLAAREGLREAANTVRNIRRMDVVRTPATVRDRAIHAGPRSGTSSRWMGGMRFSPYLVYLSGIFAPSVKA